MIDVRGEGARPATGLPVPIREDRLEGPVRGHRPSACRPPALAGAHDGISFDQVKVHTCYEIGYDGFWLHRVLEREGIHNTWWTRPAFRSAGAVDT